MIPRIFILLVALAVFARLENSSFIQWDDADTILHNPHLNPPTLSSIRYYWTAAGVNAPMGLYVPVTYTIWAGLAAIKQAPSPTIFHAFNILLHALSALIAFELFQRLLRQTWAALLAALFFALHPLQVETVGWASGTKDLLAGFFSLAALWQYVLFAESQAASRKWRYGIALICLVLAALSKPSAIVVPLVAVAIDGLVLRRPPRKIFCSLWPWFVLMIPIAICAHVSQPAEWISPPPLSQRPLIAADAINFYLAKIAFPINLAVDYGRRPAIILAHSPVHCLWMIPVFLGALVFLLRRRFSILPIAAALLILPLLPVLGFVPFQFQFYSTAADHYLYLAMLGPAMLFGSMLARRPLRLLAPPILAALAIATVFQEGYWQDTQLLFEHTLAVNPKSFAAADMLGFVHAENAERFPDRRVLELGIAEQDYRRAIAINNLYIPAHYSLARILQQEGHPAEARDQLLQILELQPQLPSALRDDGSLEKYLTSH